MTKIAAPQSFTLKGGLYTLTTLHLQSTDLSIVHTELTETVKQAPKFFNHTPIVVDLHNLAEVTESLELTELASVLQNHGLIPIGIRGGNEQQKQHALAAGWAILPETQKVEPATKTPHKLTSTPHATKLITQPVRSGQQIYAKGGDLIVMAPVSAGAEIMADGHVHVYAPLRGRAMAGVTGNTEARIFCQHLEAELIAIAGHYKVSEQLKDQISAWEKSAIISLNNENLVIKPI